MKVQEMIQQLSIYRVVASADNVGTPTHRFLVLATSTRKAENAVHRWRRKKKVCEVRVLSIKQLTGEPIT